MSSTLGLIRGGARHLRRGTFLQAILRRLRAWRKRRLHRFNLAREVDAVRLLGKLSLAAAGDTGGILLLDASRGFADQLERLLRRAGRPPRRHDVDDLAEPAGIDFGNVTCIALASLESAVHLKVAARLAELEAARNIPLEYVAIPRLEAAAQRGWDLHDDWSFIAPLTCRHGQAFTNIYRESLQRFEQKTDIRDFLDLAQLVAEQERLGLPGNLAEFGSFKGHSGYLTSAVLRYLNSDARLFMFDMFESFPEEAAGVDRFWSGTHKVDFSTVQAKFSDIDNVRLVRGDFTRTLAETSTGPLKFVLIDCDSYRATKYLLEYLWLDRLVEGGVIALEDYGHGPLLGNRLAVHEFFDGRKDAFTVFSGFSGFFIARKCAAPSLAQA